MRIYEQIRKLRLNKENEISKIYAKNETFSS